MQQILNTLNVFCNIEHFQCAALEHICSSWNTFWRTCSKLEHKDAFKAMQQILNAKTGSTPWRCSIWNIRHLKLNTCNTVVFINEYWCSVSWTPLKAILRLFIYKALYDQSYLGSKTTMTTCEWSCLISFALDPLTCSERRGGSEKFKMKIYVSSGIRTHASPRHD